VLAGGAPARDSSSSGLLLLLIGVIGLSLFLSGNLDNVLAWLTGTAVSKNVKLGPPAPVSVGTGSAADRRPGATVGGGGVGLKAV
jgi:hypothetical protein